MVISEAAKTKILDFVDSFVPGDETEVWLTGSRAKGTALPNSDWDVLVLTPDGPPAEKVFHLGTQESPQDIEGGPIRIATARPDFWNESGRYMTDLKMYGVRLR